MPLKLSSKVIDSNFPLSFGESRWRASHRIGILSRKGSIAVQDIDKKDIDKKDILGNCPATLCITLSAIENQPNIQAKNNEPAGLVFGPLHTLNLLPSSSHGPLCILRVWTTPTPGILCHWCRSYSTYSRLPQRPSCSLFVSPIILSRWFKCSFYETNPVTWFPSLKTLPSLFQPIK